MVWVCALFLCSQQPRHYTTWKNHNFPWRHHLKSMKKTKRWKKPRLNHRSFDLPNTEMLKVSTLFFLGGGGFVYIFLVMFAYFFEKYMYTMYGRFLSLWKIFGNTFPHFSGWWFQTFVIFIPICGRFPFWRAYFSNGLVQPPTSFMYHHDRLKNDSTNLIAMWGIQPLKFPSANYSITEGEKSTPED